jgi:hypothetical protein
MSSTITITEYMPAQKMSVDIFFMSQDFGFLCAQKLEGNVTRSETDLLSNSLSCVTSSHSQLLSDLKDCVTKQSLLSFPEGNVTRSETDLLSNSLSCVTKTQNDFAKFSEYLKAFPTRTKKSVDEKYITFMKAQISGRVCMRGDGVPNLSFHNLLTDNIEKFQRLNTFNFYNTISLSAIIDFRTLVFPSLQYLNLCHVQVYGVENILPQLLEITLIDNGILHIPNIFNPDITFLNYRNNTPHIQDIDFSNYRKLYHLTLCHNGIERIPELPLNGELSYLDVSHNNISRVSNLPDSISMLYLNNNRIRHIDSFPLNITSIHMWDNPLTRFPVNLLLCRRLGYILFQNTEIEMTAPEIRFLETRTNYGVENGRIFAHENLANIFEDSQNVHASSIQKSFLNSCQNLFADKIPDHIFTTTGNIVVDKIIYNFLENKETHIILLVSFKEVFQKVWNRIASQKNLAVQTELKKRLKEEMLDAESKCFMGQVTRLINVLVGFYDDITLNIGESDQIFAKVQANKNRNNGTVNIQELVGELREVQVSQEKINEWIAALKDN